MKIKFIFKSLLTVAVFASIVYTPTAWTFKSSGEAVKKLKTFQESNFKAKGSDALLKAQDEAVDTLIDAVTQAMKEPLNTELKKEILRVSAIFNKHDETNYIGEILLPLYRQDKKGFEKLMKDLSAKDAQDLLQSIEVNEREQSEGNG